MKKPLLTLWVLSCTLSLCTAQSIYYDAKLLKAKATFQKNSTKKLEIGITKANADTLLPLLFNYLSPEDQKLITDETESSKKFEVYKNGFKDNPFVVVGGTIQQNDIAASGKAFSAATSENASSGQSLTTSVIDGLAKFLVKRTKQELTSTFFDDFEKELEKQKDLQVLFPATFTILRSAKDEIYTYRVYLPALQQAFLNDVDNFLANGFEWTKTTGGVVIQKLQGSDHKAIYAGLKTTFFIGRELDQGSHPGDVLHALTGLYSNNADVKTDFIDFANIDVNLPPALQTVDLFSQSLRTVKPDRYWVDAEELKAFTDINYVRMYFGLIYQRAKIDAICFSDKKGGRHCLTDALQVVAVNGGDIQKLKSTIESIKTVFNSIENDIQQLKNQQSRKASDYVKVIQSTLKLVKETPGGTLLSNAAPIRESGNATFYIEHLTALWSYIKIKSYNAAIYEAYTVLDTALADKNNATLKAFLKYGTFIATVSTAENSDEVEAAIEAIVLPPGSASIKRKTKSNIALNAYVGLSPGIEWADGKHAFAFGVAAPIGVAFSWGGAHEGSSSIFMSIVDLGAVTAYRFSDNTARLPDLTLSNIFAPGAYYVYGIPRTPISIGTGGQLGPQLRKITDTGATTDEKVNFSLKLFLAVDIPLLNFRTKSK